MKRVITKMVFTVFIIYVLIVGSHSIAQEPTPLKTEVDKKTLEMIPKDTKADKAFLERLKKGALENLKKLEKK